MYKDEWKKKNILNDGLLLKAPFYEMWPQQIETFPFKTVGYEMNQNGSLDDPLLYCDAYHDFS